MQFLHKIRNNPEYLDACICLLSFIASQRFFFPSLSVLVSLPLAALTIFFLFEEKQFNRRVLPVMLTLFISIADEGGGEFDNLPGGLIRIILLSLFLLLVVRMKFSLSWKILPCSLLILPLLFFLINKDTDPRTTYLCGIFSIFFLLIHSLKSFKLQKNELAFFKYTKLYILPFIFGELLNIVTSYFGVFSYEYLNYTSFKFIIVVPYLLSVIRGSLKEIFFYGLVTFTLLINYQTRTIFLLTFLFSLFLLTERLFYRKNYLKILTLYTSIIVFFSHILPKISVIDSKNFQLLISLGKVNFFSQGEIFSLLKALDRYRFYENKLFFSQLPQFLIFGNGFGYKFPDKLNITKLTNINDTAYSGAELQNSYIVSFHDSWTFFGANFGLLLIIYIYALLLKIIFDVRFKTNNVSSRVIAFLILCSIIFGFSKGISYFFIFFLAAFLQTKKLT